MALKVSVLLPVYNSAEFVATAIESMLDQSFLDFELIIVNDGSTDGTLTLINSYEDSRIKVLDIAHCGVAKASNIGLSHCTGDYVARMDADDWSDPDRLLKQVNYLDRHPEVDVVASKVKYWGKAGPVKGFEKYVDWTNELLHHEAILYSRFIDSPIVNPSVMFKRTLIEKHGNYSEEPIPEDYELWLRWMDNGVVFAKIDEALMSWKDRDERLTRTHDNYLETAFSTIKARYFMKFTRLDSLKRKIYIWGHGSKMRKRSQFLLDEGVEIAGYIDIKKREAEGTIHFKEVDLYKDGIVLGFVADTKGKRSISEYLKQLDMVEGKDFFHFV